MHFFGLKERFFGGHKTGFIARSLEQWAGHPDYEPQLANMKAWVAYGDTRAPQADPVAEMIYKAATDASDRLRYPVKGGVLRAIHAILPRCNLARARRRRVEQRAAKI